MRPLFLLATMVLGFGAQAPAIDLRVNLLAPAGPAPRLAADRDDARRAWLERSVGTAFSERAKGKPWEAAATAFVGKALDRWRARSIYENDAELAEEGRRVREAKCNDPLVRCLLGRLEMRAGYDAFWHGVRFADSMGLYRTDLIAGAGRMERALGDLEKAGTPAGFLALMAAEAGRAVRQANDMGRAAALDERFAVWLGKALTDGSYATPGAEEELLIEDALGESGRVGAWGEDFHTAAQKAPLSEWARLALLGGWERGEADRRRPLGGKNDLSASRAKLAASWKLHPAAPEPAALLFREAWNAPIIEGATTQEWFDRIVAAQFDRLDPYDHAFRWIGPTWMGSVEETAAAGRACVATGRFDTAVPLYFMHALKLLADSQDIRAFGRTPENRAALVALGRGMVAEPSRQGDLARWQSLAVVWAWLGGAYREAADGLAALPGGELHPIAQQEMRYFWITPTRLRGELAIGLSAAAEDYETGAALYLDAKLPDAREAFTRVRAAVPDEAAQRWLNERLATVDFEIEAGKGEWTRVPLDAALWNAVAGKWSTSPDGALVLEGEDRTAAARFRGRVGIDYEMRGTFDFTTPEGAPRHPELGIAFRCAGTIGFMQCSTWRDGDELRAGLRHGIWTPRVGSKTPKLPPDVAVPLQETNRFHLKVGSQRVSMELNGETIWDGVETTLYNYARESNRIGFAAREPGARNLIAVRSLEIRRLPPTAVEKGDAIAP